MPPLFATPPLHPNLSCISRSSYCCVCIGRELNTSPWVSSRNSASRSSTMADMPRDAYNMFSRSSRTAWLNRWWWCSSSCARESARERRRKHWRGCCCFVTLTARLGCTAETVLRGDDEGNRPLVYTLVYFPCKRRVAVGLSRMRGPRKKEQVPKTAAA